MRTASRQALLVLVVIATGSALVACGDGSGEESSTVATSPMDAAPAPGGEASIEGFGAEAAGSEREAILASFDAYLSALAAKDYPAACLRLATDVRRSLRQLVGKEEGCAATLPALLAPTAAAVAREQANGEVTGARVDGDRAFVIFRAPGAELYQLPMMREVGSWKAVVVASAILVPEL